MNKSCSRGIVKILETAIEWETSDQVRMGCHGIVGGVYVFLFPICTAQFRKEMLMYHQIKKRHIFVEITFGQQD